MRIAVNNVPAPIAVAFILIACAPLLAAPATNPTTSPTTKPSVSSVLAHAAGETYWIARVIPGDDKTDGLQTQLFGRTQSGDGWQRLARFGGDAIELADYKRDAAILLASGDWVLAWRGDSSSGQRLPGNATIATIAGNDNSIWAVGAISGGIGSIATTAPASQTSTTAASSAAATTNPTTSPTTVPAAPPTLALFSMDRGHWTGRADLPESLRDLNRRDVSLALVANEPVLAARYGRDEKALIAVYRFSVETKQWVDLGEVDASADISRFEIVSGMNQPTLWLAPKTGGGTLYTRRGTGWSAPIALVLPDAGNVTDRAVAVSSERLRLVFQRGDKIFEQKYELAADRIGQKIGEPTEVTFPAPPADPRISNAINIAVMVALLLVIFGTVRRRGLMQQAMTDPGKLHLAPQGLRLLAGLVDAMPLFLTAFIVALRLDKTRTDLSVQMTEAAVQVPMLMASLFIILHTMVLELLTGRSLGKMVCGLRVVTLDGQKPGPGAIILRNVLRFVDLVMFFTLFMILYSPLRQRVGDIAAGTVVVRSNRANIEPADPNKESDA